MKKLFVASLLTISSSLSISTQIAQASNEVDDLIRANETAIYGMCQMNGMENCEYYNPEYKQAIKELVDYCLQGYQKACDAYNKIVEEYEDNTSNF